MLQGHVAKQSVAHLWLRTDACIKAPHGEFCKFKTHHNTESSTTEVSQIHQTYPQATSKCALREEPCWSQKQSRIWLAGLRGASSHRACVKPGTVHRKKRKLEAEQHETGSTA